jgi:hypothetical protein
MLTPFSGQVTSAPAIEIENSALVTIAQTTAFGSPALRATVSKVQVHIADSALTGSDAKLIPQPERSYAAVHLRSCRLELTNSVLTGGNGVPFAGPSPALVDEHGFLRIAGGDSRCVLQAGTGIVASPAPAIRGTLTSLSIDPGVVLIPYRTAPKIEGTVSLLELDLPALQALGAPPGGVVQVDLFAPAGNLAVLFVGPPANTVYLWPFRGDLALDPTRMLHALTAVIGASQRLSLKVSVPNDANLRGLNWVWQGLTGTVPKGFLLTNRANYVQD